MKFLQQAKNYGSKLALAGTGLLLSSTANADILTDADAAITAAKDSALAVGGYVVAAVAALIVIGLIITMVRKV